MKYPNLELLEYKAKQCLSEIHKINRFDLEVELFTQMWGSTNTGFDVTDDNMPTFGGCSMTREYTTIFHEKNSQIYVVFFGSEPCYSSHNPSEKFFIDKQNKNMASLSKAKELY